MEARHGVNGYEMYKNHNYIVNTYNYENDYFNLKPPLSYWGIILGFKLFGVSIFSMRFYSALSLLLTFLVVGYYMHRHYGKIAAVSSMLFSSAVPICSTGMPEEMLMLMPYISFYSRWHCYLCYRCRNIRIISIYAASFFHLPSLPKAGMRWFFSQLEDFFLFFRIVEEVAY